METSPPSPDPPQKPRIPTSEAEALADADRLAQLVAKQDGGTLLTFAEQAEVARLRHPPPAPLNERLEGLPLADQLRMCAAALQDERVTLAAAATAAILMQRAAKIANDQRRIVAFLRTEAERYREAMPGATEDAKDRMAPKISELITMATYIEPGDFRTPFTGGDL